MYESILLTQETVVSNQMSPENEATSIVLIIAIVLLVLVNAMMVILNIKRKKDSENEVTMDVDDYLTLILEQIDQIAEDSLKMASLNKDDFKTERDYHLAILEIAKERLFECGVEYGLSPSVIKLINSMKLDSYILDAIKVAVRKKEFLKDSSTIESNESEEISVEEPVNVSEDSGLIDISKELSELYNNED